MFRLRQALAFRWRYWSGKFCKEIFGRCASCATRLNITRYGQGICPHCRRRI